MTDTPDISPIRSAVSKNLGARYRAELRFRAAGLAAVAAAVGILIVLLSSIVSGGLPAFTVNELELTVDLEREVIDPLGDGSEESLRRGGYSRVLQSAMRAEFPEVQARRDLRNLFSLYTALNATRLMDEVLENPGLIGSRHVFTMPLADDLDLYLKGLLVEDRVLDTDGALSLSVEGDAVTVRSSATDFRDLAGEFARTLRARATLLEVEADTLAERAEGLSGNDAEDMLYDAELNRRRALDIRATLERDAGPLALDASLPSVLVEVDGRAVALTSIAADGATASGRFLLGSEPVDAMSDWTLYVIDTPAERRRVSDQLIVWTRALEARGVISSAFNTYLFANADSREPELAGVKGALFGSILTMIITITISVPIGVFTALYLEEYAPKNRFTALIEVNINNLAAVPSIVFGLLGLAVFINAFGLPRSAPLVGGLVLSLMTLPTVIIATRAALKAVPQSIRQAALAVGASRTQTVFHHVLPLAAPGILTGSIIGLAQAMGETAPLLMIGMVAFIADAPTLGLEGFTQPATVMPVQIFLWSDGAERAFEARTAAAILVLLALMIGFNALAIYLRRRFERRW
ncbi:phosphate ABC transporter permease [Maricaulis sp. W15]|uniref:Phosphate transport system permease protein PstA n=1 Tax=Maricaulis maris TaxID=74318 RepID=A0A495DNM7_9PROT|nr:MULTISPECIES: phosphate ABC transporter permease PstA [Maricaulis]OLF81446.1 phosphate ABC transporter permease [Maricaulis sp. W15]RKR03851.1 phosphate ABC transporter membrane protein 2 (PhoT family) [Maricaulis maris]